nr:uncharacterized protein LOC129155879 [Nothobranchius furzeri]
MWAVKYFANYIGGQKIIIETQHQPVTFLNSQRIRDGVVTNARIASWLLALQSFDIEVRYAQNRRSPLGMGLAACQHCSDDAIASVPPASPPQTLLNHNHHYFDQSFCVDLPTVYVDTSEQYLQDLKTHLPAAFSFAQATLEKSAEGRNSYYDKKASHSKLDVGDEAWYYIIAPKTGNNKANSGKLAKKLLPEWSGPCLITNKLSPVVYQIKITCKNKAPVYKWVHRDHIKLHKGSTDLVDANNDNLPTSKGG